ncbi:RDD family protein [Streptomyces sp. NBC_00178]|uniref:RDD family protein n=1 Tax=Streptomyces sp. NBC_00178 TaxID=2975672 RepID=UPI002E2A2BA6|nr:RDD family protein [Streptomyces sp. NBC_00178]
MSAPTPAPGDERPSEGYYPDPSIPGYVRYWNGASWVPGTSRPAPAQSGSAPAPQPAPSADPAPRRPAAPVEETGPMYFDEVQGAAAAEAAPAAGTGGSDAPGRPRPASAWQAATSRQTGFGGDRDRLVSWGGQDPRTPDAPAPAASAQPALPAGRSPAGPGPDDAPDPTRGALPGMRDAAPAGRPEPGAAPAGGASTGPAARTPGPRGEGPARAEGTMAIRALQPGATAPPAAPAPAPQRPAPQRPAPQRPAAQQPAAQQPPHAPQAPGLNTPLTPGPGGGSASWAQQAHQLARPEQVARAQQPLPQAPVPSQQQAARPAQGQPVVPWKPPADDPFQQLARAQAAARPAGLGRRLAARLVDTLVLGALVGAVALPLVTRAVEHIDRKIEAAEQSGETVTVYLLDSTTAGLFGGVLAAFLLLGFLLEALPTAKWGRTLGKRLCGLQVRDIETHDAPSLGAALRRWLVYGVLGLVVVGVVNVLWCLVDRPWRQCWHDKAARTFVAG